MRESLTGFDYTNKDYESLKQDMISGLQEKIPEYTDTSETDAGIVIIELLAKGLDILSYNQDVQANENFLVTAERRENILGRCYELAYEPEEATPSYFYQVFVLNNVLTEDFIIPKGTVVKTTETATEESVYFETMADLIIPTGKLGNEKDNVTNDYLYVAEIIQGSTIEGDLLGSSDGSANQKFTTNYDPVILDTLVLSINEGSGYELWERVETFLDSDSTSKHFKATIDDDGIAIITFGDGLFGKIPNAYTNGIFAYYRIGGGAMGNVSANTIVELEESIAEISETFNPSGAFMLGTDRESLDSIKVNAPNHNRTKWGAITLQDHTDLVKEYFSIQVKFVTSMQDPTDNDRVLIYIVPTVGNTASDTLKSSILSFFQNDRQFVGGSVGIMDATFTEVNITAVAERSKEYTELVIRSSITSYLTEYFAVGNYNFNTPLNLTDLESSVKENVSGLTSFRISVPSSNIVPAQNEILTLGTLNISVVGG
jgi:hypothetical protein